MLCTLNHDAFFLLSLAGCFTESPLVIIPGFTLLGQGEMTGTRFFADEQTVCVCEMDGVGRMPERRLLRDRW